MLLWLGLILSLSAAAALGEETDGQSSRKILGSSVVTSVSVVMETSNGKHTMFSDPVGNPMPKPQFASQVASPINLLNPDRYEFYTFNDSGELIKRLMTLDEIQGIIAGGDSETLGEFSAHQSPASEVSDIVENVQNVLKEEMEAHKTPPDIAPVFDTPDVSDTWNMILPAIFGDTMPLGDTANIAEIIDEGIGTLHTEPPKTEAAVTRERPASTTEGIKLVTDYYVNELGNKTSAVNLLQTQIAPVTKEVTENYIMDLKPNDLQISDSKYTTTKLQESSDDNQVAYTTEKQNVESTVRVAVVNTVPQKPVPITTNVMPITVSTEKPENDVEFIKLTMPQSTITSTTKSQVSTMPISSTQIPALTQNIPESTIRIKSTGTTTSSTTLLSKTESETMQFTELSTAQTTKMTPVQYMTTKMPTNAPTTIKPTTEPQTAQTEIENHNTQWIQITRSTEVPKPSQTLQTDSTTANIKESTTYFAQTQQTDATTERGTTLYQDVTVPNLTSTQPPSVVDLVLNTDKINVFGGNNEMTKPNENSNMASEIEALINNASDSLYANEKIPTEHYNIENVINSLLNTDMANIVKDTATFASALEDRFKLPENIENKPTSLVITSTEAQISTTVPNTTLKNEELSTTVTEIIDDVTTAQTQTTNYEPKDQENLTEISTESITTKSFESTTPVTNVNQSLIVQNKINSQTNLAESQSTTQADSITESTTQVSTTELSSVTRITEQTIKDEDTTTVKESSTTLQNIYSTNSETTDPTTKIVASTLIINTESTLLPTVQTIDIDETKSNIPFTSNKITTSSNTSKNSPSNVKTTTTQTYSTKFTESIAPLTQFMSSTESVKSNPTIPSTIKLNSSIIEHFSATSKPAMSSTYARTTTKKPIVITKIPSAVTNKIPVGTKIPQTPTKTNNLTTIPYRKTEEGWKLVATVTPPAQMTKKPNGTKLMSSIQIKATEKPQELYKPTPKVEVTTPGTFGVPALSEDMLMFSKVCNELALKFWNTLAIKDISSDRSAVVSPFGAISLLAMIFLGARGGTSGEMNDVLKLDDIVTFNPHLVFKDVTESILARKSLSAIVRELYSDNTKGKLLDFYKERARQFYNGHVEEVDFKRINDIVRRRTNMIVNKQTKGHISEYFEGKTLALRSPLSALSTNIFQVDCSQASIEGRDGELYFIVLPSMRQRRLVPIPAAVWRSGFIAGYDPELDATAVSFTVKNEAISTIFVIPGQQGHSAPGDVLLRLEARLLNNTYMPETWAQLLKSMLPRPGLEVQVPRFLQRSILNISSSLQRMGLKEMFDMRKANLRGLNSMAKEMYFSDINQVNDFSVCGETHQMHMEVYPTIDQSDIISDQMRRFKYMDYMDEPNFDEYLSIPLPLRPRQARVPDVPRLRFDRPFLYFVRHNPTGLILHIGRFNPRLSS